MLMRSRSDCARMTMRPSASREPMATLGAATRGPSASPTLDCAVARAAASVSRIAPTIAARGNDLFTGDEGFVLK